MVRHIAIILCLLLCSPVYAASIKHGSGGAFVNVRVVKTYSGGQWVGTTPKFYSGAGWVSYLTFPIFLMFGQSQMTRMLNLTGSSYSSPNTTYEYNGYLQTLNRTSWETTGTIENPSGFESFCDAFYAEIGKPFGIIDAGVPGAGLLYENNNNYYWRNGSDPHYDRSVTDLNNAITAFEGQGFSGAYAAGGIWCQGEREADVGESEADYETAFKAMADDYRTEYGTGFELYIIRTGRLTSGDTVDYQNIRAAQDDLAADNAYIHMVYTDAVNFVSYGWMEADGVHWTIDGYDDIGQTIAPLIAQEMD